MQRWWQLSWQQTPLMLRPVVTATDNPGGERAPLTAAQRRLRARMAAYSLHATHDPLDTTRAAREAFMARFERQVDPDGRLPAPERQRRAEAAKKAYFAGLALKSAKARGGRKRSTAG